MPSPARPQNIHHGLLQSFDCFGPIIGVCRSPEKVLLITSDVLCALLIGLIPCLIPVESFTVTVLYVLVLLHAIATADSVWLTAAIPAFVPKPVHGANALQSITSLGIIFGPAQELSV